jgi:transcription elongation factor Elf1
MTYRCGICMLQEAVLAHKGTYSDDYMRDFIDIYLKEMKMQQKTGDASSFSGGFHCLVLLTRQLTNSEKLWLKIG